jgi:hypothetical protein
MRLLLILALLLSCKVSAQVPVVVKGRSTQHFDVKVYAIRYYMKDDSVKIRDIELVDIEAKKTAYNTYEVQLEENGWYLVLSYDQFYKAKNLYIETGPSTTKPYVYIADFSTNNDYYVNYDIATNKYVGELILFK